MFVKKLSLLNFRNFEKLNLEFSPEVNIIYGDNAQGKTNLLESLYFFATGRSHRTSKDSDLLKFNENEFRIDVDFFTKSRDFHGEVRLLRNRGKKFLVNDIPMKRLSDISEFFKVVLFSPDDLSIIRDGPIVRRNFFDEAISILKPNYLIILSNYNLALCNKNNLLKAIEKTPSLKSTLSVWNARLAEYGSRLMIYRMRFLKRILEHSKKIHSEITVGKEELDVLYSPSVKCFETDRMAIYQNFYSKLESIENIEMIKKMSILGPHRDDYIFCINEKDVKDFGSQGQRRTIVLTLKLSIMEIIFDEMGEYPVLLLDDIMSELDASRREFLTEKIKGKQVFITGTEKEVSTGNFLFHMREGRVI